VQHGGAGPAAAGAVPAAPEESDSIPAAGPGGGGVISAELNDEVLVAFDRGMLDHPFVIGGLYNGQNAPSAHDVPLVDSNGRVNRRSLVSRSGNRLELLDAETEAMQGVRLKTGNGKLTVFLDQAKTEVTITSTGAVSITGSTSVSVESGGPLSLKGTEVSLAATGSVSVTGPSFRVSAPTSITGVVALTGAVDINGAVAVNGGMEVTGDILMDGQQVLVI
jgi:hypothetical protein